MLIENVSRMAKANLSRYLELPGFVALAFGLRDPSTFVLPAKLVCVLSQKVVTQPNCGAKCVSEDKLRRTMPRDGLIVAQAFPYAVRNHVERRHRATSGGGERVVQLGVLRDGHHERVRGRRCANGHGENLRDPGLSVLKSVEADIVVEYLQLSRFA